MHIIHGVSPSFFGYVRDSAVLIPRPIFSHKQRLRANVKGGDSRGACDPLPLTFARAAIMLLRARIIGLKASRSATQPGAAQPHPARSRRAGKRQDPERQTEQRRWAWERSTGQRANDRPTEGTSGRGAPPRPRKGGRERAENERREPGAAQQPPDATPAPKRENPEGALTSPPSPANYTKYRLVPPCGACSWRVTD